MDCSGQTRLTADGNGGTARRVAGEGNSWALTRHQASLAQTEFTAYFLTWIKRSGIDAAPALHGNDAGTISVQLLPESTGFRVVDQSGTYLASVQATHDLSLSAKGGDGENGRVGGDGQPGTSGSRGQDATQYSDATVSSVATALGLIKAK